MNAMMVLRGHRADYDGWAAAGCPGWSWQDVEPAFARSRACFPLADVPDRHVLAEAFVHAAQAVGIPFASDLNDGEANGVGFVPVSQRRGRRFSVDHGYLRPARGRPNLTVVTGALVTRVLIENGRATGVAYRPARGDSSGEEVALAGSEVVLSAGAVGTPQLLQLSGVGPRSVLDEVGIEVVHELAGVGANLLDHLANGLLVRTRDVETLASAESLRNLVTWAVRGRGPLTSNLGEAVAYVKSHPQLAAPDLEFLLAPVLFEDEGLKTPTEHGLTLAVIVLDPRSVGTVKRALGRSAGSACDRSVLPHRPGWTRRGAAPLRAAARAPDPGPGAARPVRRRRDRAGRSHGSWHLQPCWCQCLARRRGERSGLGLCDRQMGRVASQIRASRSGQSPTSTSRFRRSAPATSRSRSSGTRPSCQRWSRRKVRETTPSTTRAICSGGWRPHRTARTGRTGQKIGYQDVGSWTILKSTPTDRAKAAWLYAQFTVAKTASLKKSACRPHDHPRFRHPAPGSFTERSPKLGGWVEFYRSPDRWRLVAEPASTCLTIRSSPRSGGSRSAT